MTLGTVSVIFYREEVLKICDKASIRPAVKLGYNPPENACDRPSPYGWGRNRVESEQAKPNGQER